MRISPYLALWSILVLGAQPGFALREPEGEGISRHVIIKEILIVGANKTDTKFMRSFLESRSGEQYDSLKVVADLQRLRNLQLFRWINHHTESSPQGIILTIECLESSTLLPTGYIGGIRDNVQVEVGLVEHNWRGRASVLAAYYRYYDRHSVGMYLKAPFMFSRRLGLFLDISRHATTEPAYFQDGATCYDLDRWTVLALGRYGINVPLSVALGGGFLRESYMKNKKESQEDAPGPDEARFTKFVLKGLAIYDGIAYFHHYRGGWAHLCETEVVKTEGERDLFWKLIYEGRFFVRNSFSGNMACRLRAGVSQNKETVFVPFVLDSNINVRGIGDRTVRGTAELTVNLEYLQTLFQEAWGALLGVTFIDVGMYRPAGDELGSLFESIHRSTHAGLGFRFVYPKFHNLVLRIDYGADIEDLSAGGLVFGIGQFF